MEDETPDEILKRLAIKNSDEEYIESDWGKYKKTNEYQTIIKAMQEFAQQESKKARNEAIQECIDALKSKGFQENDYNGKLAIETLSKLKQ